MSVVTGIMLIMGYGDDHAEGALAEVQAWLAQHRGNEQLIDVSDGAGGRKHPQFHAMAAGLNGFVDETQFAAFVLSRDWICPENVVLVLQPEQGITRVFRPIPEGCQDINAALAEKG